MLRVLLLLLTGLPAYWSHFHEYWERGRRFTYPWYRQAWVQQVQQFYCDDNCQERLQVAPTIDREFSALIDLFNQTTGGPRDVYRGAFEGLDEYKVAGGSRRETSLNTWKHMEGWETILQAHTSTLALCTELKLDGNVTFTRSVSLAPPLSMSSPSILSVCELSHCPLAVQFCYEYINASLVVR